MLICPALALTLPEEVQDRKIAARERKGELQFLILVPLGWPRSICFYPFTIPFSYLLATT